MSEYLCPYCYGKLIKKGFNEVGSQRYGCKNCGKRTVDPVTDGDLETITENVRLSKKAQRHQDTNRIERKAFREHARIENAYTEYTKELINVLKEQKFHVQAPTTYSYPDGESFGIIQLSDLHFNELVQDLGNNEYSFEIASKRLRRLADESKRVFASGGISNVLIACTGDFMNSDRRLDELLSNATNRSKATFLAVDILQQFIRDIAVHFTVTVASVTGNEGRVDKEPGWNEAMATHNYDYTIHKTLALLFEDTPVNFMFGDPMEQVVEVGGLHILMLHGHSIAAKANMTDVITKIIGKWSAQGVKIDYVIFGHVHEASIGDIYSRSSSLVGANAYSEHGLHLISRASQNIFVIDALKNINGYKIDLQNTGDVGYDIDAKLAEYNAKSSGKLKEQHVIFSITI
jgi:predicted phosphodiesterase